MMYIKRNLTTEGYEVERSKKIIRGQIMVMRGHMVKGRKERLSHMICLGAELSFDIHHEYVLKH